MHMNLIQEENFARALTLVNEGDYAAAGAILKPLWDELPTDYDVFQLLNECYRVQENWGASEALILQFGQTPEGEYFKNEALLGLYLGQKDLDKALQTMSAIIAQNPDFYDAFADLGNQFKSEGFEQAFLDYLSGLSLPGYNRHMALAGYHAYWDNDFQAAIDYIKQGLEEQPGDALLLGALQRYEGNLVYQKIGEAEAAVGNRGFGGAVGTYKAVLDLMPGSVTAQEYYLFAVACKIFPPLNGYFRYLNITATTPYAFRAILYLIFFVVCAFYYRDGLSVGSTDYLKPVVWLLAALSIPRYTLVPLLIQLLSLWYVPGYHLLKKPVDFIKGAILLGVWLLALRNTMLPNANGFHFFLTAGFVSYVLMLEYADEPPSSVEKRLLRVYAGLALCLAVLSYAGLIPEVFLFLVFGAWLPPIFAGMLWKFYQKYRDIHTEGASPEAWTGEGTRIVPKATVRLQLIFGLLAAAGFAGFVVAAHLPAPFESAVMMPSFAFLFFGITVSLFCSEEPGNVRDMGWNWRHSAPFRRNVLLFGLGMLAGVCSLIPLGNVPLALDWRWIPGAVLFFACWFGLAYYLTRQLNKP